MAKTMQACETHKYWIKMPEIISNFGVVLSFTQRDMTHYLDQEK